MRIAALSIGLAATLCAVGDAAPVFAEDAVVRDAASGKGGLSWNEVKVKQADGAARLQHDRL